MDIVEEIISSAMDIVDSKLMVKVVQSDEKKGKDRPRGKHHVSTSDEEGEASAEEKQREQCGSLSSSQLSFDPEPDTPTSENEDELQTSEAEEEGCGQLGMDSKGMSAYARKNKDESKADVERERVAVGILEEIMENVFDDVVAVGILEKTVVNFVDRVVLAAKSEEVEARKEANEVSRWHVAPGDDVYCTSGVTSLLTTCSARASRCFSVHCVQQGPHTASESSARVLHRSARPHALSMQDNDCQLVFAPGKQELLRILLRLRVHRVGSLDHE